MDNLKIWPEWKVAEKIGKGSFGTVYRIVREGKYQAALKVIDIPSSQDEIKEKYAEGMDTRSIIEMYQMQVDFIRNEIEMMESLKTAIHVVTIEDYKIVKRKDGAIGWRIYIRMEYLQSMGDFLKNGYTLSENETVKLGLDICDALRACQALNIIHRDIKPGNIFRTEFGDYKLGDFGISRQMESTCASTRIGTPTYEAPEILRGEKYDKTVDIYGLGMVLYTYLNRGRKPFYPLPPVSLTYQDRETAERRRLSGEKFPDPVDASPALGAIIRKACAYNPRERYQDAEAFYYALDQYRLSKRSFGITVTEGSPQRDIDDTIPPGKVTYQKPYDYHAPVNSGPKGGNNGNTPSEVVNKNITPMAFWDLGFIIGVVLVVACLLIWNKANEPSGGGSEEPKLIAEVTLAATPTPKVEATPTDTPTPKVEATPTATPTPKVEAMPLVTPIPKVEATPTVTPTPNPSQVEMPAIKGTLMADPNRLFSIDDNGSSYPVFGTPYERKDISFICFLDSLAEASKDSIDISEEQNGSVLAWFESDANGLYKMYIAGNNGVIAPTDSEYLFQGYTFLKKIEFNDAFDTRNVADMSGMFYGCESLTTLDVNGFDTSNVTDMGRMVYNCDSLTILDVSGFNTSNVTDMGGMFYGCESLTTLDVSGFDTSNVTDMGGMFYGCESLTTLDVSGFDTSNVTKVSWMFYDCKSLTSLDVSGFKTGNVTDMSGMFKRCYAEIIGRGEFPYA